MLAVSLVQRVRAGWQESRAAAATRHTLQFGILFNRCSTTLAAQVGDKATLSLLALPQDSLSLKTRSLPTQAFHMLITCFSLTTIARRWRASTHSRRRPAGTLLHCSHTKSRGTSTRKHYRPAAVTANRAHLCRAI